VELLPKFCDARNALEYHLAIAEMAARAGDASCLARSAELGTFLGTAPPPFEARFVEKQLAITHVFRESAAQPGDVIVKIAGEPVKDALDKMSRYFAGPLPFALANQLGHSVVTIRGKDGAERDLPAAGDPADLSPPPAHRSGDAIRMATERIGYADLERIELSDLDAMFEKFRHATAIVFDLRGHPRDLALAIGARLGNRNQPVMARLQRNVVGIEPASHISYVQSELRLPRPAAPRYTGKTAALIDDASPGIAGESAMCFKAANDTVLIGSAVLPTFPIFSTVFDVPGGAKVSFSGQSARWPDGTSLEPGGVHPDLEVLPTLAGIRAGRDEVLVKAIEYLSK